MDDLLSRLSVGDEVPDLERCQKLATAIEALFGSEARAQYAGHPGPDPVYEPTALAPLGHLQRAPPPRSPRVAPSRSTVR